MFRKTLIFFCIGESYLRADVYIYLQPFIEKITSNYFNNYNEWMNNEFNHKISLQFVSNLTVFLFTNLDGNLHRLKLPPFMNEIFFFFLSIFQGLVSSPDLFEWRELLPQKQKPSWSQETSVTMHMFLQKPKYFCKIRIIFSSKQKKKEKVLKKDNNAEYLPKWSADF